MPPQHKFIESKTKICIIFKKGKIRNKEEILV